MYRQLDRMREIAAIIRRAGQPGDFYEKYPSSVNIAALLNGRVSDMYRLDCSAKTVRRTIERLQAMFGAPIAYSAANRGYYFTHEDWEFEGAVLTSQDANDICQALQRAAEVEPAAAGRYRNLAHYLSAFYDFSWANHGTAGDHCDCHHAA